MTDAPTREERDGARKDIVATSNGTILPASSSSTEQRNLLVGHTDDAVAFLEAWSPGGPWVLTSIVPDGGKTTTATFTGREIEALRRWIDTRQGRQNLYFTVNRTFRAVERKPSKADMAAALALHVDIDPRAGEELESERARALKLLREFRPSPTVIIDSGGGYQGFWLLDAPYDLSGDAEDERRHLPVEQRSLAIEIALQADRCHNIDRIMRLPGTINVPGKKKLAKGRKPALARVVVEDWERRYQLEDFLAVERAPVAARSTPAAPTEAVELDRLPVSDRIKALIVNGADPDDPTRLGRSEAVFAVLCELARAGVSDSEALSVILDPDFAISAHVREQKKPEVYARRQIERAREEADASFDCDKEGRPLPTSQRNIRLALRKLGVIVRHNQFSGRSRIDGLDDFGPGLDDPALDHLWLMIDERFGFRPGRELFLTVTRNAARRTGFHPVVEYLAGLRWDGVPRIGGWLAVYGGAEDTAFVRAASELVLIAAVRRVRQPGVKFDEMLVLEGAQGTNKSSALKVLAVSDEWFTDDLPLNAKAQQVIEILSGKWIVEAGELNGMRRGGIDQLKGFLSRTHDKARMAYDRLESEVARQCIIVGTTNDRRYLRDTTGGRRFWPVAVERFDLEALRRDRDQLWAEAAAREAEGASIRLDPALYDAAAAVQDERRVEDPFYERLHTALGEHMEGKLKTEDAWQIVGKPGGQRTQDDNARLGDAMRRLGFERMQRRFGGKPEYCYLRGDGARRIVPRIGQNGDVEEVVLTDGGPIEPF